MSERKEGWGSMDNASRAHYFRESRSLCGKWLAFSPHWESYQARGPEPKRGSGTCKACWHKAPAVVPMTAPSDRSSEFGSALHTQAPTKLQTNSAPAPTDMGRGAADAT